MNDEVEIEFLDEDEAKFKFPDGTKLTGKLSEDQLSYDTLNWFSWYLERVEEQHCSRDLLTLIGRQLFKVLFADPIIKATFVATCAPGTAQQPRQIRLEFNRAAVSLARLPWEFLYIEQPNRDGGGFLAERNDLVLVRHVEWQSRLERGSQRLKVLLVVQSPQDKTMIATVALEKLLSDLADKKGDAFTRHVERDPDWGRISSVIGEFKPDVFHFAGHGEKGALWLAQGQGDRQDSEDDIFESFRRPRPVSVSYSGIGELFRFHTPRLVILDACDTAAETAELPSVAHAVLDKQVQAVVAMRYKISNLASEKFSAKLYSRIAEGARLDVAVQEARVAVGRLPLSSGNRDGQPFNDRAFGTPILYLDRSESVCDPLPDRRRPAPSTELAPMSADPDRLKCLRCGKNQAARPFCGDCGQALRCKNDACRTVFPLDLPKFCRECGNKVPEPPPYIPDRGGASDHFVEPPAGEAAS